MVDKASRTISAIRNKEKYFILSTVIFSIFLISKFVFVFYSKS